MEEKQMHEFTIHANRRLQQRGLSFDLANIVLDHGTAINTAGALFYFMSNKDVPNYFPISVKERIIGMTLVVNPESNDVMTVYKNRHALKDIRKKERYNRNSYFHDNNEEE
jgi:hypothetical protein